MAERVISVDTDTVRGIAKQVDEQAQAYETAYKDMYNATDSLQSKWQGVDNAAFNNQIAGFKEDLQNMKQLMVEYADYLRQAAQAYEDAQNALKDEAARLAN